MNKLLSVIVPIADYLLARGVYPTRHRQLTEAIKSAGYYDRELRRMIKNYYNGYLSDLDFIGVFSSLVEGQMYRAYLEGLMSTDFDINNMTGAMYAEIDEIRRSEENYILDFIQQIKDAKEAGTGFEQFNSRADVWVNRYFDVQNRGTIAGAKNRQINLLWKLGATEQHCTTCASMHNKVMSADDWSVSGIAPQQPPNANLECGGWRCDCSLSPTSKKVNATLQDIRDVIWIDEAA